MTIFQNFKTMAKNRPEMAKLLPDISATAEISSRRV